MNEVFKNNLGDTANFSDNGITLEYTMQEKKIKQYYPYGSIMSIKVFGLIGITLEITGKDIAANGKNYLTAIPFNKVDKTRMKSAVAFAESKMRTAPREKVVVTDCTSAPVEHHMRCNICRNSPSTG